MDRATELKSAFYTSDWKYVPVTYGETPIHRPRPHNLGEMIRIAEALADGIDFVRVDLLFRCYFKGGCWRDNIFSR